MDEADAAVHWKRLNRKTAKLRWNRRGRPGPRFLGTGAPEPWIVFDLDGLWEIPGGVPDAVSDDIQRLTTRAFRLCTEPDEWIYAEVEGSLPYRFWPHRQPLDNTADWPVGFFPDGDDDLFISQDFTWGVNALFLAEGCEWGLTVFGQPLFDAFTGHWPKGWAKILRRSDGYMPRQR
jgi:hypothetical protein